MKSFFRHLRKYLFRGFLAMIPIALSVAAIYFLYNAVDRRVGLLWRRLFDFDVPGLGILTVLVILYLVGLIVSNAVGRQVMSVVERVSRRMPLIRTTYQIGKQFSSSLSLPEGQMFKRPVLIEFLRPGVWTLGFVTGTVEDRRFGDERYLKVFVPTPPNPTSGTMVLARESQTRDPGWTLEEALKTVISGGIIGPDELREPSEPESPPAE